MNIQITTGKYELIDSGFIVAEGSNPVRFSIDDVYVELRFYDDGREERTESEVSSDNQGLVMRLYNVVNPLGSGFHDIRNIATVNGVPVYFSYSAAYTEGAAGKKLRHISYSIYKEGVVDGQ
ncbi:DUF6864 domain-containing function [Vibrio campbellii]|uniref:DUF6864 domain-containing function n=1 Tax=Vibrio campbellii TaxID=680 RepID=UPI003F838F5E